MLLVVTIVIIIHIFRIMTMGEKGMGRQKRKMPSPLNCFQLWDVAKAAAYLPGRKISDGDTFLTLSVFGQKYLF